MAASSLRSVSMSRTCGNIFQDDRFVGEQGSGHGGKGGIFGAADANRAQQRIPPRMTNLSMGDLGDILAGRTVPMRITERELWSPSFRGRGSEAAGYCVPSAMACRTWPFVFLKAAAALERLTPAASITTATGVRFPLASRARRRIRDQRWWPVQECEWRAVRASRSLSRHSP